MCNDTDNIKSNINDYDGILELSKSQTDFSKTVFCEPDFFKLDNLSPIRANIMQWYPFTKGATVLELCAECGSVTEGLVDKNLKITSITNTATKAEIIKSRFKEYTNLNVLFGDWKNIIKFSSDKYDYIVYFGGALTIEELQLIKSVLTSQGVLLIATENRNGMKYIAGCKDNYSGSIYDGVEDYHGLKELTYDMPKWKQILFEADFDKFTFHYPYPDHHFCEVIYSDDALPKKNQLLKNYTNFDKNRVFTFDEGAAFNTMISYGIFPLFSNSYFIEAGNPCGVIYTKFSKERNPQYTAYTNISLSDNKKGITKHPANKKAEQHIQNMNVYKNELKNIYSSDEFNIADCKIIDNYAEFEFINGETLSSRIDSHIEQADFKGLHSDIEILNLLVSKIESNKKFVPSAEFIEFFGESEFPEGLKESSYSLIDLIGDNIILNDKINIIDYEWVLSFPVPTQFIKFRTLLFSKGISSLNDEQRRKVFLWADVDYNLFDKFFKMEYAFQDSVSSRETKMEYILEKMDNSVYSIRYVNYPDIIYKSLVYDQDDNLIASRYQYNNYAAIDVVLNHDIKKVVLKATPKNAFMQKPKIFAIKDGKELEVNDYSHNADYVNGEDMCFLSEPTFTIVNDNYDSIKIKYNVYIYNSNLINIIYSSYEKTDVIEDLKIQIADLKQAKEKQELDFKEYIENHIINREALRKKFGKKSEE